ncbi:MAG: hypothetical protein V7711_14935 [Pseudomonadales bacterium]
MSNFSSYSMKPLQFLNMAGSVLHKTFFDSTRQIAKRVYKDIVDGKRQALMTVALEDKSEMQIYLSLDHSEYRGTINFSQFRRQIGVLVSRYAARVQEEGEINLMTNEETGAQLLNIPAVVADGDQLNVLVLGWISKAPGTMDLQLMFLDPEQFRKPEGEEAEPASE